MHQAYNTAASFVPKLTAKVQQLLDPQPTDEILDIGSGDGELTGKIAPFCHFITGLDASRSFYETAITKVVPKHKNSFFFHHDCRWLQPGRKLKDTLSSNRYDKVFSNAALHWILRDETARIPFFDDVLRVLRPGGTFVFEMGGAGNVAEVHATIRSVLFCMFAVPLEEIRKADPWFFPSEEWMRQTLTNAGFQAEFVESFYRPTKLNPSTPDGSGGLEGWVKLMGAPFLNLLPEAKRSTAVRYICEILDNVITHKEDGGQYLGYVRLRVVARKPEEEMDWV